MEENKLKSGLIMGDCKLKYNFDLAKFLVW